MFLLEGIITRLIQGKKKRSVCNWKIKGCVQACYKEKRFVKTALSKMPKNVKCYKCIWLNFTMPACIYRVFHLSFFNRDKISPINAFSVQWLCALYYRKPCIPAVMVFNDDSKTALLKLIS